MHILATFIYKGATHSRWLDAAPRRGEFVEFASDRAKADLGIEDKSRLKMVDDVVWALSDKEYPEMFITVRDPLEIKL